MAIEIYEKEGSYNLLYTCYGNLADYYESIGKKDSAIYYIDKAVQGFENGGAFRDLSVAYVHKAKICYVSDNIDEALFYTLKSKKIAQKHSFPDVLLESTEFAYELYKERGDLKSALQNLEIYRVLSDSLHKEELLSHQDELIAEYSISKREKEIELLKTKDNLKAALIRKQQNAMLAIGLLAIIIAVITISVMRRLRIKRKANEILADKNEEINAQNEEIRAQSEEIVNQNKRLIEQKEEITDSINYARFIQTSIFTSQISKSIEHFRFNKPKDIVSGDFFLV
jgi:tetratricopeptide (TPR) repeat protein